MGSDGISRLIAVTQQKAENANDEAMAGADKQSSLIKEQKSLRGVQRTLDEKLRDSVVTGSDFSATKPAWKAGTVGSEATVAKPADYLARYSRSGFEASSKFSSAELMKNLVVVGSSSTRFASGIGAFVASLKKALEESQKDLEGQDKLSNFEINNLASSWNRVGKSEHNFKFPVTYK